MIRNTDSTDGQLPDTFCFVCRDDDPGNMREWQVATRVKRRAKFKVSWEWSDGCVGKHYVTEDYVWLRLLAQDWIIVRADQ